MPLTYHINFSSFIDVIFGHLMTCLSKTFHQRKLLFKTGDNELIPHFWRKFLHPYLSLHTNQTQVNTSKRNIQGPSYTPKGDGFGGNQRKSKIIMSQKRSLYQT